MKQISTGKDKKESEKSLTVSQSTHGRQAAFIEAYLANAFNVSAACRAVGIDRSTYYRWANDNNEFRQILDEARESKKDFIETALLKRVAVGDTIAIIFACKCLLSDRGYIEKNQSHITHSVAKRITKEERDAVARATLLSIQKNSQNQ